MQSRSLRFHLGIVALCLLVVPPLVYAAEAKFAAPTTARTEARAAAVLFADQDCAHFATGTAAQEFYVSQGGPTSDPHGLDADHDGIACETLKG